METSPLFGKTLFLTFIAKFNRRFIMKRNSQISFQKRFSQLGTVLNRIKSNSSECSLYSFKSLKCFTGRQ